MVPNPKMARRHSPLEKPLHLWREEIEYMIKNHEGTNHLPEAARSIEDFPCPVIALINGYAFGAGLELAISCDYRVCVDSAKLGMPPAKLGVLYSFTGIRKFLNLIGSGYTKEMFLS